MNRLHSVAASAVAVCALLTVGAYVRLSAHSIDYLSTEASFSPAASAVGGSGNWSVVDDVAPGATITFDLTYDINTGGNTTTYPRTITFGATTVTKPAGAANVTVTGLVSHIFNNSSASFTDTITMTAPASTGAYSVKIQSTSGTGGSGGLGGGNGIVISFTVGNPIPTCANVTPTVTVTSLCGVLLHQTEPVTLSATIAGITPLEGQSLDFYVDGVLAGTSLTDATGHATLSYDASQLSVGDHLISVYYSGDDCATLDALGTGNLGVTYLFQGFQQPVNADGSSQFGGRTIPVKVKISDALGASIPDADVHVFFALGTPVVVGTDAEPLANTNADSGNTMRYDASANQYIFNWDIAGLANGTYTIRVDLGDGTCADPHSVIVSMKKKGSK